MMTRSRLSNRAAETLRPLHMFLVLLLVLVVGVVLGWRFAQTDFAADPDNPRELRRALAAAQEDARVAVQETEALRTRSEVDRQSLELVRREMVAQKQYATELEDDLRFYRSLMSPEASKGQLRIGPPEFVPGAMDRHYAYSMVIRQEAAKHQLVKGTLQAEILGMQNGELVSYDLADIGVPGVEEWPEAKFRYFQEYSGEFVLPPGFEPQKVTLTARASKPRKIEVQEEYPWPIQEQSGDVGQ